MVSVSLRCFVTVLLLFAAAGCETYTRVTQKEFRTILFDSSNNDKAVLVDSDDEYDYYRVGSKRYKVPHRYVEE